MIVEVDLIRCVQEQLGTKGVTMESTMESLGADSLDMVEIGMAVEDEFEVEITDDELASVVLVQDLRDLIVKKKSK